MTEALNVPWSQAVNEDGTYKSREELAALYGSNGLNPEIGAPIEKSLPLEGELI